MNEVLLSGGMTALVDDSDWTRVMRRLWHCRRVSGRWVAFTDLKEGGVVVEVSMQRYILGVKPGVDVEYLDGNGLNNQRKNLRVATRSQNNVNSLKPKNNTSGFKGVYPHSQANKWCAQIGINGRRKYLGYFDDPREAALVYNEAAIKHFGEFAQLNSL